MSYTGNHTVNHIRVIIYGIIYGSCHIRVIIYGQSYMVNHIWDHIRSMSYTCNHIRTIIYGQSYMRSYTVHVIHPHPTTLISLKLKDVGKYFTLYELKKKVPPPPLLVHVERNGGIFHPLRT